MRPTLNLNEDNEKESHTEVENYAPIANFSGLEFLGDLELRIF